MFDDENEVTLTVSSKTMDLNKFELKDNIYDHNFIGMDSYVTALYGVKRTFMTNETYSNSQMMTKEALETYGAIQTSGEPVDYETSDEFQPPWGWAFSAYHYEDDVGDISIQLYVDSDSEVQFYYPQGILLIDGAYFANLDDITFDNNGFPEYHTEDNLDSGSFRSNGINLSRWFGHIYLTDVTFQNYHGIDLANLEDLLGATEFANIVLVDPTERDGGSDPIDEAVYPEYNINWSFKNPLIRLMFFDYEADFDFANKIEIIMDGLTLTNITYYNPSDIIYPVMELTTDGYRFEMENTVVDGFDNIQGQKPLFKIISTSDVTVEGGIFSNINVNAYDYDTTGYSYLPQEGSIFSVDSFEYNDDYEAFEYSFSDMTFDNVYGLKGSVFYMSKDLLQTEFHPIEMEITNVTFQNMISVDNGVFYSLDNEHDITISNCTFQNNTGINGEADLYYQDSNSFTVSETTFTESSTSATSSTGLSITINMPIPFAHEILFEDIAVRCSDTAFDADTYQSYLEDSDTYLNTYSPILISPGQVKTMGSTFSN